MTIFIRMSNPDMDPKTVIPDAVVLAALNAEETVLRATAPWTTKEIPDTLSEWPNANVVAMRAALTAAADAINPEDARPWEPLNGGPVRVGDKVRRDLNGITTIGVVGRVSGYGDPYSTEEAFIGRPGIGTWHVIRTAPELPKTPTTIIVPNDGYEAIEATVGRTVCFTSEAMLGSDGRWYGVWRRHDDQRATSYIAREDVNPYTWKVEEK